MKSTHLSTLLKPYKLLANKHALSPTYRCIQLSPGKINGCSASTILETACDHGLDQTVCVDASSFLTIMDSLPANKDVAFSLDSGVLSWQCGSAKGQLAPFVIEAMPTISRRSKIDAWKPDATFVKALRLGGLSCDSASLLSVGMFGIVIDNRGPLIVHSSDNITVSAATAGPKIKGPELITMTPEPAELLAMLIQPGEGGIEFDDDAIYYRDKYCKALIRSVPALKYDALEMVHGFSQAEMVAPLPADLIASFIKRAGALAENKRHTYITLEAKKGQLSLTFSEGVASTDEFYLVEGLDVPDLAPIHLDASKLARVMANVTEVVLDHIERSVVVMRGRDPEFSYLISGRQDTPPPV